ncbi:MAG: hypothetical protein P4L46_01945 [Fimbriimonas sp.]|nr:hypothetical protein [Fimbriimonas sp.]
MSMGIGLLAATAAVSVISATVARLTHSGDFQSGGFARAPEGALDIANVPAPFFRDPIFDGAADPSVVWNEREHAWYVFYTQRRANQALPGVSWYYGTKIGIAKSVDGGRNWDYFGTAKGLSHKLPAETYWAPHVFFADGKYHMFVAFIPMIAILDWSGKGQISHFTSRDLTNWKFLGDVDVKSDNVIDPGVVQLRDGRWLMVFRDQNAGVRSAKVVSKDLEHWTRLSDVTGSSSHEAPVVLFWKDRFWLFVDEWQGIGVYESPDGIHYTHNSLILDKPGKREDDGYLGSHPGVALAGDRAFVFYHVHAGRVVQQGPVLGRIDSPEYKRSSLQVAELELVDGKMTCDRDKHAK